MSTNYTINDISLKHRLQAVANLLLLKIDAIEEVGLLNGKAGICLFFYLYYEYSNKDIYEETAGLLLDSIYKQIHSKTKITFLDGLSGVGWLTEYLCQKRLIEAETEEVLDDIDLALIGYYSKRTSVVISNMIFNTIPYIIIRMNNKHSLQNGLCNKKLSLLNNLVINDCKTVFYNLNLFPNYEIPTIDLLSIIYFFVQCRGVNNFISHINQHDFYLSTLKLAKNSKSERHVAEQSVLISLLKDLTEYITYPDVKREYLTFINLVKKQVNDELIKERDNQTNDFLQRAIRQSTLELFFRIQSAQVDKENGNFQIFTDRHWPNLIKNLNSFKPDLDAGIAGLGLSLLRLI